MICNYNLTKARKPSLLVYKALEPIRRHPPACFTPSPTLTPTVTHRSEPVSISTSRYLWSLKQLPLRPPFIPALTPSQPSPQFSTSASPSPSVPMITCALPLTIIIASAAANLPSGSQTSLPQYFYMKHPPTLRSVLARSACLHSQTRIKPIKPITWSCAPAPLTPTTPNRASSFYFSTSSANSLAWDPTMLFLQNPIFYSFICSRRLHTEVHCSPSRPQPCSTSPPRSSRWRLHSYWRHWRYSTRPKTFWLLAQKFSGVNVSSVGSTLSKDAAVIPINDYKIINASKLSSSSVKSHVATYYTTHNRASYAVCKICYDSKDNNGTVHVKNCTDNTKNHAELRAFLNPANTAAVVLLRDSWPSAEEYEGQEKHRVLYCRFFVLVVNCRFLFLLISDIFVLIDFWHIHFGFYPYR